MGVDADVAVVLLILVDGIWAYLSVSEPLLDGFEKTFYSGFETRPVFSNLFLCDTRKCGEVSRINRFGKCLESWWKQISMAEFDTFSYGWIVNDSIELFNFFVFLVVVMVFVNFPQEGSGGGSDSLEENFPWKNM